LLVSSKVLIIELLPLFHRCDDRALEVGLIEIFKNMV
jgi:hypothetical protein